MPSISQTEVTEKKEFNLSWLQNLRVEAMGSFQGWDNLWHAQYYKHLQIRFQSPGTAFSLLPSMSVILCCGSGRSLKPSWAWCLATAKGI